MRILLIFAFTFQTIPLSAQTSGGIMVPYINIVPVIDGELDSDLTNLKKHQFEFFDEFDNPATEKIQVTYSFAYSQDYLYLYIEADADTIHYHKRGYLWGDGYKLLIGMPEKDGLTEEYYELSYSPTKLKEDEWDRQRIAAYNGSQKTPKLSEYSKTAEKAYNGKSGFESLIAWSDIEPYHPAFMNQMGYGLYFAKGKWREDVGYFANGYSVVHDPGIFDEAVLDRRFNIMVFEVPDEKRVQAVARLSKRNIIENEPLIIKQGYLAGKNNVVEVEINDEVGHQIYSKIFSEEESIQSEILIDDYKLPVGLFEVSITTSGGSKKESLAVHPKIDFKSVNNQIRNNNHYVSEGVVNTLLFRLNELAASTNELLWYEEGVNLISDWELLKKDLTAFFDGEDPFQNIQIPYRRAFLSKQDSTFQPYSIKLPENYDSSKKYPLLVFLHGSGTDEQGLLNRQRGNGKFIELAPFGRDKYFAYANNYSQVDIYEAIHDVIQNFSVDTTTVVIGGFSMGGYGALRTYYEYPDLFKGVAVFSGHPNLASMWLDEAHPNFTDSEYLRDFKDIPVFIYHGDQDPALDVDSARNLIYALEKAGARVTARIVEGRGHVYQDDETNKIYHSWLNSLSDR